MESSITLLLVKRFVVQYIQYIITLGLVQ